MCLFSIFSVSVFRSNLFFIFPISSTTPGQLMTPASWFLWDLNAGKKQTNKTICLCLNKKTLIFLREHDLWSAFSTNPARHLHLNESPSLMQMCWQLLLPCAHASKPGIETETWPTAAWMSDPATERGSRMLAGAYVSTSSHPGSTRVPLDTGRRTRGRCWHTGADSHGPERRRRDQQNLQRGSTTLTTATWSHLRHRKFSGAVPVQTRSGLAISAGAGNIVHHLLHLLPSDRHYKVHKTQTNRLRTDSFCN